MSPWIDTGFLQSSLIKLHGHVFCRIMNADQHVFEEIRIHFEKVSEP